MDVVALQRALESIPVDRVLYCVGYDRNSPVSKESLYLDGLEHAIRGVAARALRWVYVSSSSVYGQDDGSWVDENSPTEPSSEGGKICLRAEQLLRREKHDATILRMSGLYGPERLLVRQEQLRQREPIGGNPHAWLNLIHGDDAASACVHALSVDRSSPLYLVSDNAPIPRRHYYEYLAERIGAPTPAFSYGSTSRHNGQGINKRCNSQRIQTELGVHFTFPSFREGLAGVS